MTPKLRETFARNMKRLRKATGMTQERLAELTGYSRPYIGVMEQGKQNFGVDTIERICAVLGADAHVMMTIDPTVEEMLSSSPLRAAATGHDPGPSSEESSRERPSPRAAGNPDGGAGADDAPGGRDGDPERH